MSTSGKNAWERYSRLSDGLYRDRENGWILGVCAGLADRFNFDTLVVRIVATVSLLIFTIPTALAYFVAALFIRRRPLIYRGSTPEQEFWRGRSGHDRWSSS